MFQLKREVFRSRLFLNWLLSYVLILLLPLLTFTIVFWSLTDTAQKDVYESREAALWQFSQVFNQRLGDVETLAIEISLLSELNAVKRSEGVISQDSIYHYWILQNRLQELRSAQSFIQSIDLYVRQSDALIGNQSWPNMSTIWEKSAPELIRAFHRCLTELPPLSKGTFLLLDRPDQPQSSGYLVYAYPLSVGINARKEDIVFIVVNTSELKQILTSSLYDYSGSFFITDGQCILSLSGSTPFPESLDLSHLAQEGRLEFSENGVSYTAMHLSEQGENLQYIHIFENDLFSGATQGYLLLYGGCLLISVFVGFALSLLFSLHNYHPVQALGQLFRGGAPAHPGDQSRQNELQMIFHQVQDLQKYSQAVETRLTRQSEQLREAILIRTLRGEISSVQQESALVANGFTLDEVACVVLLALLPGQKEVWRAGDPEGLFSAAIGREGITAYPVQVSPRACAVLLTASRSMADYEERLQEAASHLAALLKKHYPTIHPACSSTYTDLQKLSNAYTEAEQVLEYNRTNDREVLFYPERGGGSIPRPRVLQQMANADYAFLSCVRLHNFEGARNCLEQVLDCQKAVGIEMSRFRLYGLANLLLAASAEISSQLSREDRREMDQIVWELLRCESVAQAQDLALQIFQLVEKAGQESSDPHRTAAEILEEAKDFIEEHYTDTNLSVSMTAEAVNISVSYLTQLFKKHLGHSTADHIHLIRLEHAKVLLTGSRIKEVAKQVGYQDVRSLIRVFKKYENKTPSQFRDTENDPFFEEGSPFE